MNCPLNYADGARYAVSYRGLPPDGIRRDYEGRIQLVHSSLVDPVFGQIRIKSIVLRTIGHFQIY